jgi:hypothetical protein
MQMDHDQFHIDFKRSGGLTGISTSVEIDSTELAPESAGELKQLIEGSGFFEAFTSGNSIVQIPDQFRYDITIEHMGKKRTLELSDGNIPDLIHPLIHYLVRLARTRQKSDR